MVVKTNTALPNATESLIIFEVSKPEQIINFFIKKNYKLLNLKTCGGGHGNNEFLFKKIN